MAELTPKTIGELPEASSLSNSDIFPVSSGGATKRTLWSTIKKYFVRKAYQENDVYISANSNVGQFLTIWQTANNLTKGLVVSDTTIGAFDSDNNTWLWRLPHFQTAGAISAWPVSIGGTGGTTPLEARTNLGAADAAFEPIYLNVEQGAKTLSFSGLVLFLLVSNFTSDNRQGMWIVSSTATGSASVKEVVGASAITVTAGTGQITVNSGTLSVFYSIIPLSSFTAGRITIT